MSTKKARLPSGRTTSSAGRIARTTPGERIHQPNATAPADAGHVTLPNAETRADGDTILRPLLPQDLIDFQIPPAAMEAGLRVIVPIWDDWGGGARNADLWRLSVNGEFVTSEVALGPHQGLTEFDATIPPQALAAAPEGVVRLSYSVTAVPSGSEAFGMDATPYKDTVPPGGDLLGPIQFEREIVDKGLSSEKLTELGDVLDGEISDYYGMRSGDIVHTFVMDAELFTVPADRTKAVAVEVIPITDADAGRSIPVRYTRAQLEAAENGLELVFFYHVQDQAGLESLDSPPSFIATQLRDAPRDLLPPRIPQFDDGIIDEQDARADVQVRIPAYRNAKEGDQIVLFWGNVEIAIETLGPIDESKPEVTVFPVRYRTLQRTSSHYTVDVTYEVRRDTIRTPSPPLEDVLVDLTLPGGPDPEPETPELETLGRLTLRGATATEDNIISPADAKVTATAVIPGMTVAIPPGESFAAFALNDQISVIWDTQPPGAPHRVTADEVGSDIRIEVPSTDMIAAGAGDKPVTYSATRLVEDAGGNPVSNVAYAPAQIVLVLSEDDIPGGPDGLPDGNFTEKNRFNAINKSAAESGGGTPFQVGLYKNKKLGDAISIDFVQYTDEIGGGSPLEASRHRETHVVGPDDVTDSFDFLIPTAKLIIADPPIGQSALAFYTVITSAGISVTSDPILVLIDIR